MRSPAILIVLMGLAACRGPDPQEEWLEVAVEIATPAGVGSRFPHLAALPGGAVISWLEPDSADGMSLRHSTWAGGAWSTRPSALAPCSSSPSRSEGLHS